MAELQPFQSNDESEYMKLVKQEELLDSLLATPDNSENGAHDRDWLAIATQLEKQLAEESGSIDKETMIRILSKSISAIIKLQINDAITNDLNLEQIAKHRIDDYHYSQTIIDGLPKKIKSEIARKAAQIRADKFNAKKDEIINYWRANIRFDISNDYAAELLQKEFPHLVQRTLSNYVAEAKNIPPAGTL
jgi:hypothetical protein